MYVLDTRKAYHGTHAPPQRDAAGVVPQETLGRVAPGVISSLGPGPVQTHSARSYTAKAPVTCVRGVATNRMNPGVNRCCGQRWERAFTPRSCAQRSAHEVLQLVLVQTLSGAYPCLATTALASCCQKHPGGSIRCPTTHVWPLGCASVMPTAQHTKRPSPFS